MDQSLIRLVVFLAGLSGLRCGEMLAPHHQPTVPILPRWFTNLGLGLLNSGIVSLACAACFRLSTSRPLPLTVFSFPALPTILRILVELVLLDFIIYLLHRAYHRVPFLWRLHAVHHTDPDLDVSSASRFHPGEVMLSASIKVAAVFILGISPVGLVVFEAVMLACAQFQHANLSLPSALERWLWHTFVPPEMHRIHHTPKDEDTNSNYGTIFTLWDRLFGTLNARRRFPSEPFGVTELSASSEGLPRLLVLPFRLQLSDKPKTSA